MTDAKTAIADGVYWVGAKDPGRKSFDALVPLPLGTTYNAYLVQGKEKTALLDTVDPAKLDILFEHLKGVGKIDYVISHHAEQDHSGSIIKILEKYPQAKVVTSPKGREFLANLIHLDGERVITVSDREKLDLGGKTLEFISIPWSHWPETMASFLHEDGILFPCDLFGMHWSKEGIYESNPAVIESSAKRYYAEIMMPYAAVIKNHLPVMAALHPRLIAPSHGPVINKPEFILELYGKWINNQAANLAVIPYVSMHGSTGIMVDYVKRGLEQKGIKVKAYNVEAYDVGEYAMDLVDAATVIFAAPTVVGGMHPLVAAAAYTTNILKPKAKWMGIIGSYGWGGQSTAQFHDILKELAPEFMEPVLCKGLPRPEDFARLDILISSVAHKHRLLT